MTPKALKSRLEAIADSDQFSEDSEELANLCRKHLTPEHVVVIIDFMANNPDIYYGMPGELTHLAETLEDHAYEEIIVKSVSQKPTAHTAWMLHRLMNGTKSPKKKAELLAVLKLARKNAKGDSDLVEEIDSLLS